jgi:c-di-GMP-binding flagellar brake protein YcgR
VRKTYKGGFMDFTIQQDIERQLQEISDLSMPVTIIINDTIPVGDCRLIYRADNIKELYIQVAAGNYPVRGNLKLTCSNPKASYTFKSKIISRKEIDSEDYMYFKIEFPDKVTEEEKRQHFRVRPSATNPIQIRLAIPDSDSINVEVMDIGGGGISFAVLKSENYFNVGDSLYLDINLPTYNWLSALVVVKNITILQNMIRIGVEFSRVSEEAYKTILQYVTSKMTEK